MAILRNMWNDKNHDRNVLMADNGGGTDPVAAALDKAYKERQAAGETQNIPAMPTYNYVPSTFGYQYGYKPTQFQYNSQYTDLINAASERLRNWNYNPDEDVSYNAYRNQYTRGGQQAMSDALARYASRTGGVASSYAASAAQQSYNNYMSQLAAKVPELERLAYDRAVDELDYYTNADNNAYSRAFGEYTDWEDRRRQQADTEYENAYRAWQTSENARAAAAKNAYNASLAQWEAKYGKSNSTSGDSDMTYDEVKKVASGIKDKKELAGYLASWDGKIDSSKLDYLARLYGADLEGWLADGGQSKASVEQAAAATAQHKSEIDAYRKQAPKQGTERDQVMYLLDLSARGRMSEPEAMALIDELGLRQAYRQLVQHVNPSRGLF